MSQAASSPTPAANTASPAPTTKSTPVVKRLSPTEITQCHKDEQCFHYDKYFTQGHMQVYKQSFYIEVIQDDDGAERAGDQADPMISIHALTRIQPRFNKTMQVYVDINSTHLHALINFRSTHNFVDLEAAAHASIALRGHLGLGVQWLMMTVSPARADASK
jgi:hypothetical protein